MTSLGLRWSSIPVFVAFFSLGLAAGSDARGQLQDRPNILWITSEDIGPNLGVYGDADAVTPTLDRLASSGVRYASAFSVAGVCASSRSGIITGMYPSSLGSHNMRSMITLPPSIGTLPGYLRAAGYYCSNNRKQDYNFSPPPGTWDESSGEAHWRKRKGGQPFFSVFNLMTTHEQYLRAPDEAFSRLTRKLTPAQRRDPAKVALPGWLPDTPAVRREWARYHELITAMDYQVEDLLEQLKADGLTENTIVFFFSDHGAGFPRAKQFNFESGLRVPLIVSLPEKWRHLAPAGPGKTVSDLVSLVDLAPSVLALAGVPAPGHLQGQSFLGAKPARPRAFVHSVRDRMDERIDLSRTVRDQRFKYQRNYLPHLPHFPSLDYMDLLETSKEFRRLAGEKRLSAGLDYFMSDRKSVEELYDLQNDPDELRNLAGDPRYADDLRRLREAHLVWARQTVDAGLIPEHMAREFARGSSEYEYARSEAYLLDRCLSAVRLVERGGAALPELVQALADVYPPVRYWAAAGLASLGTSAGPARPALIKALGDRHPEVAIMAAEALCAAGESDAALPVLSAYLAHPSALVCLAVANSIDRVGDKARSMIEVIRREAEAERAGDLFLMVKWLLTRSLRQLESRFPAVAPAPSAIAVAGSAGPLVEVGLAQIDITPTTPVRLHGFPRQPNRLNDIAEVAQPLRAKAMALGSDVQKPVLLITADLLGVSSEMTAELAVRLAHRLGFSDPARLTLAATHAHSAPALATVAPFVFRQPPSKEHAESIRRYGEWLMDRLEAVAVDALANREPARLDYSAGSVGFGVNRRVIKDGTWTGFGVNPAGPVDHDLPMITVRRTDGSIRAVWLGYACHGICWQKPSFHGDWMGTAQRLIEANHPGVVALITIGCAGDQNPAIAEGNEVDIPAREIAVEVERLLAAPQRSLAGPPEVRLKRLTLPLASKEEFYDWSKQKDWFSRTVFEKQNRGEPVASTIPYVVQTWTFADELAVVFLAGEVTAGYGLRLKRELAAGRVWVNAYANDVNAYIPTAVMLPEGGWEVDGSRLNYGLPARVAPEAENLIVKTVHGLIPPAFGLKAAAIAAGSGQTKESEWWKKTGHPKGKWWLTYPGYDGEAADKIWERVPIPPSPIKSPEEALRAFDLAEGLRIELVAAEPMVVRPVHMKFDAAGRLWVVEMPGYMRDIDGTGENDPSGRVVVLEDSNGDGKMDKSTTFLDGLVMPRTLAFVEGGVLVVEPPRIWYARDTNGDLVCDQKTLVASDYGEVGNPEHSANGLLPALDNWMYSAKSAVRYRWVGGALRAEPTLFRGQWGITQDDTGRLLYNYNASPLHVDIIPGQYVLRSGGIDLSRPRGHKGKMTVNLSIAEDKSLYPIRVTPLVTLGASDLRPDGTLKQFTSACAPLVFRGDGLPERFRGNVFICDPVGNLVSLLDLKGGSPDSIATRAYENREFLASTDERFRPVAAEMGPDGALYIADMYTAIVEHKRYVTPYLRQQVLTRDLEKFTATGRIYRIVSATAPRPRPFSLANAKPAELVRNLSSNNGWVRDTAQRLLVESRDPASLPAIREAVRKGDAPLGRLHALWSLEGLDSLDLATVRDGMRDADPRVRAAALRLSERFLPAASSSLMEDYRRLATDGEGEVKLQLLLSLGQSTEGWAMQLLADLLKDSAAWWNVAGAATAVNGRELEFVNLILGRADWKQGTPGQIKLLEQLGWSMIHHPEAARVGLFLALVSEQPRSDWRIAAVLRGALSAKRVGPATALVTAPALLTSLKASADPEDLRLAEVLATHVVSGKDALASQRTLPPLTSAEESLFEIGRAQYALICAACHQVNGQGLPGVAPSLVGSAWVTGPAAVPIRIVLQGLTGPIEVNGETWNMLMPGFGAVGGPLDDEKIAGVLTYTRRQWGNEAGAVTPAQVTEQRQATAARTVPWTAEELSTVSGRAAGKN